MRIIMGMSPYVCSVEAKKLWGPRGISSSNVIVSIANHSHTFLFGDPEGSPLKIAIKIYYICEVYGDKSDDTALLSEHVITLYLLCIIYMYM